MKILFAASDLRSLHRFRTPLIEKLKREGHAVYLSAPDGPIPLSFENQKKNPAHDIRVLWKIYRTLQDLKPDIIFSYHLKPTLYMGLVAYLFPSIVHMPTVTGLGYLKNARFLYKPYRLMLKRAYKVFVQNEDDIAWLKTCLLSDPQKYQYVPGSGIDLRAFPFSPLPDTSLSFLFIGRFIKSKGVIDYIQAIGALKKDYPAIHASVIGKSDTHPEALEPDYIERLCEKNGVDYIGYVEDIQPYLQAHHIFVLPSTYPEGVPRAGIEALAIGRPIITTNHPGCKDLVNGRNGILISTTLEEAMRFMIKAPLGDMSFESRALAESKFDVEKVNEIMCQFIQ